MKFIRDVVCNQTSKGGAGSNTDSLRERVHVSLVITSGTIVTPDEYLTGKNHD